PVREQAGRVGAFALGHFHLRRPDVDESDDALVFAHPQQGVRLRVVGGPAGQPVGTESQRLGGLEQGKAGRAGAEQAFLRGNLDVVGVEDRQDRDHQRCVGETLAVLFDRGVAGRRVALDRERGQGVAKRHARVTGDADEPERYAPAVVRHARRGLKHAQHGVMVGPRRTELPGRYRASRIEEFELGKTSVWAICGLGHRHEAPLNGSYSFRAFRLGAFSPEMTQHDDFDPLTAPARGRASSEAVRTYETIKRNALTEMAGVLSGFWGSIEEQVRLAALAGHDYSANQDDRVAIAALHQRALELAARYRDAIEREFGRWLEPKPPKPQEKSLSLMSEDELEIHLAGQQTTELLDHQFLHPLELMDERLQSLANALGVQGKRSNPMRPEAAVNAFTGLFERDDLSPGLRVMVFRLHEKRLPHALG